LKGKYIYLAFGSFSCGRCRVENREIAKRYAVLSRQVAIVNFSLDINHKEWEAAAKAEGIVERFDGYSEDNITRIARLVSGGN
jgi:hypothetical protein